MLPTHLLFSSSVQSSIRSLQNDWRELEGRRLQWISESAQRKIQDVCLKVIENLSYGAFIASVALTFTVSPWFLIAVPAVAVIGASAELIRERVFGFSTSIDFLDYYERELNRDRAEGPSLMKKIKYIKSGFKKRRKFLAGIGQMSQDEKREHATRQKPSLRTLKLMAYILSSLDSIQRNRRDECIDFIQKAKNHLDDSNLESAAREAFLNLLNKIEEDPVRAQQLFEEIKRVSRVRRHRAGRNGINAFSILGEFATA